MFGQTNFKIEIKEKNGYWYRMGYVMLIYLLIMAALGYVAIVGAGKNSNLIIGILAASGFWLLCLPLSDQLCACFISSIIINTEHVTIAYSKRNKQYIVEGTIHDFIFTCDRSGGLRSPNNFFKYLQVTYKDDRILRQYNVWEWGHRFEELLSDLRKGDLLDDLAGY